MLSIICLGDEDQGIPIGCGLHMQTLHRTERSTRIDPNLKLPQVHGRQNFLSGSSLLLLGLDLPLLQPVLDHGRHDIVGGDGLENLLHPRRMSFVAAALRRRRSWRTSAPAASKRHRHIVFLGRLCFERHTTRGTTVGEVTACT